MKHSVGRNIAQLRLSQGMTQERLAQRMGVTPQAVSKWENDLNYPDIAALPGLAALLGTSVDALLTVPDDGAEAEPEDAVPTRAGLTASPASPAFLMASSSFLDLPRMPRTWTRDSSARLRASLT